ncbi:PAS domain S-box protein [Chitinophaga silvatica]|uniref:histidine kinase n=1 Tax=Chitinophaga silvatica TaxID=2282649 RepID=A0A3E1YC42_9BACT|nr:PAS domain S-box protein [Chitinophaga silvatica]RFS23541.1 PAS domain S-box protein [Chitinophaga silvatica]
MKKVLNTVLALVLVVVMALVGFVYYAWMVQKRSKSAAENMIETNRLIDKVRTIYLLESNYTNGIRDMLLNNNTQLAPNFLKLHDSIQFIFNSISNNPLLDSTSQKTLHIIKLIIARKKDFNQRVIDIAPSQPDLARQLITSTQGMDLRSSLITEFNHFLQINRNKLISRVDKDLHYTLYSFWTTIIISIFTLILIIGEGRYIYRLFLKLKKSANQLHKREQSFMRLAEETELIVYKSSVEGFFTNVSKRAAEMTGYSSAELVGQHYSIFLAEETFKELEEFYVNQIKNGDDYTFKQFEIITKSGVKKWVEQLATIIYGNDGKVREFQCMVRDIDKEKRNEDQFQYLQERLESIIDYMPSMMFVKDMPGRYLLVNNRFSEMMNVAKKDIIGKTDQELSFAWVKKYAHLDEEVLTTKNRVKMEDTITVDGKDYHFLITKFPLRNADNEMIGICGIGQDFTEKTNYIIAVEEANKRGQEAIAAQEMFLANMSHEIRTPMNGIIGMTNLMLQNPLTPKQLNYANAIKSSATRLMSIITEVLDFSKIKAGKLSVQHEMFDIYEVINNTLLPLKLQAEEKELQFITQIDNNIPTSLVGDDVRLTQIITNIVENAIKFTEAGTIKVRASFTKKELNSRQIWIQFIVSDTGIGIAPEKHELIFKSFSQTHSDNARKFGGAGLGLAITKELLNLLNGNIELQSNLNEGSTFYFELPFDISEDNIGDVLKNDTSLKIISPLSGKSILIVEDDEINQQVAIELLRDAGSRPDVVSRGSLALNMLDFKKYDCIIMDIQMPEMDGYETTRRIRQKGINTYIIAMTASALKDERSRCLAAGMNDYIAKPFDPSDLFYRILKGLGEKVVEPTPTKMIISKINEHSLDVVYNMFSGNKANVIKLLKDLVKVMPQKFSELNQLASKKQWDPFYILAHQIKFNLNVAGMPEASILAQEMEMDARQNINLENMLERIQMVESIYLKNIHYVETHIAQA